MKLKEEEEEQEEEEEEDTTIESFFSISFFLCFFSPVAAWDENE